ncbi:MAG: hypothetical protein ACK5LY_07880 [Lachnospirales bacterium]
MVYNQEFLNDYLEYIKSTFNTLEEVANEIIRNEGNDNKIKAVFEDYINLVKLMDFCIEKDSFFVLNTEKALSVLKDTMTIYESNDLILLYDFMYYAMANEIMLMFQSLDAKLLES